MNLINSDEINQYFADKKLEFKSIQKPNFKVEYERNQQRNLEASFVQGNPMCPSLSLYKDKLPKLTPENVKTLMNNNFYDPEVMSSLLCVADSIFYSEPINYGSVTTKERIREFIFDLKRIGAESAFGYAMKADLGSSIELQPKRADSAFIIKVSKRENIDLLHELFIGLHLNRLRNEVLNFAYSFGGFKCSFPFIATSRDVVGYCNSNKNSVVDYILYENITPGITLRDYIVGADFNSWLNSFLQILYALNVAKQRLGFTHYDLHDENIILRKTPNMISLMYQTERGYEYINTDFIATIIDYGKSYIKLGNSSFGTIGEEDLGYYNQLFPLHDVYKLLMFSIFSCMKSKRTDMIDKMKIILEFFTNESPLEIIKKQNKNSYSLPNFDKLTKVTIFDLTGYIRNYLPTESLQVITGQPLYVSLSCSTNRNLLCLNDLQVTDYLFTGTIDNVFEFYDVASKLIGENKIDEYNKMGEDFRFQSDNAINEAKQKFNLIKNEVSKIIDKFPNHLIIYEEELPDFNILSMYKNYVMNAAQLFDKTQHLLLYRDAISYTCKVYGYDFMDVENSYNEIYKEVNQILTNVSYELNEDISYLRTGISENKKKEITDFNKEFRWWWNELPVLADIIIGYNDEINPIKRGYDVRTLGINPYEQSSQLSQPGQLNQPGQLIRSSQPPRSFKSSHPFQYFQRLSKSSQSPQLSRSPQPRFQSYSSSQINQHNMNQPLVIEEVLMDSSNDDQRSMNLGSNGQRSNGQMSVGRTPQPLVTEAEMMADAELFANLEYPPEMSEVL